MEITSPDGKEKYTLRSVDGTKYERIKTEPIEIGDSGESVPRTKEDLIENIEETSTSGREEVNFHINHLLSFLWFILVKLSLLSKS